jgi:small basic protein (TIGR04137 family)
MHSSLKAGSKIATKRNVLKRFERIDLLQKKGKWKEGSRAFGLPKTKSS